MMQKQKIAIAATFTAQPVEESLSFWMREVHIPSAIEFAPYNQVFQQLLDPSSLLSKNTTGTNVILVRLEDWQRFEDEARKTSGGPFPDTYEKIERNVQDLVLSLKSSVERSSTPHVICLCPASDVAVADSNRMNFFRRMEEQMASDLDGVNGAYLVTSAEFALYPVSNVYNPHGDEIGHIPFTPLFYCALGTLIARKIYALKSPRHKVIVLDCDHTLWNGVCAEDGAKGIVIDAQRHALQEFMVAQHNAGMLICLCSKNNEEDVTEVFDSHPEMPLRREHLVSWRINWQPKSENIRSLADELNLGLDSFILIDDNPIECAEVRTNCHEVLVLQLPRETTSMTRFIQHVWAFDHLKSTEEDKKRTILYRQNVQRQRHREASLSFKDFLEGLDLSIQISSLASDQISRASQLTERTNQFNFTTIRRSESEIEELLQSGFECLAVDVTDRFGHYGLVGVIIFQTGMESVKVDTFLLSCRALGRGVEHRMLSKLGEIARERRLSYVDATYVPTKRNQPARDFLDNLGDRFKQPAGDGFLFRFPADAPVKWMNSITDAVFSPASQVAQHKSASSTVADSSGSESEDKSTLLSRIALELYNPQQILMVLEGRQQRSKREVGIQFVPPRNPIEKFLTEIISKALRIDRVGVHDNFLELGGHSLRAVEVLSEIRDKYGVELSIRSFFNDPTVASFASEIAQLKNTQASGNQASGHALPVVLPAPERAYLPFPLTDIQQAYWIGRTGAFELGNVSTHIYLELESVDLDLERFNVALQRLIDRHDMLRAIILPEGRQQVLKEVPPYQIEVSDLRGRDPKIVMSDLEAIRQHMSHQVLPSDQCPLFEIRASRLKDRRVRLHVSFDALIGDAYSLQILVRELHQLYKNPDAALVPLELTFREYVLVEASLEGSELYKESQEYWWDRLSTIPPAPELPLANNPSSVTHPRFVCRNARLEKEIWQHLKNRAARAGLTPSGVLLTAFAEVLKVWSKNPRFTINLTLFNRLPLHAQVNSIVGDFTSVTLLAVENSEQDTFEGRARSIQQQFWDDLDHRYLSGVKVLRELARRQSEAPRAGMPVVFTSLLTNELEAEDPTLMTWMGDVVYGIAQTPQVWLDHIVLERAGELLLNWNWVEKLFPEGLVPEMFDSYCHFLKGLAHDDKLWQDSWPETVEKLLPPAQLEQRASINATEAPIPADMLHTLFARQVAQRQNQPAVISSDRTLTYDELSRRSNQVGRRLRQLGVKPNTLVGLLMEKGWEQIVAVLGTLVSGAAYLPIDAGLPKERLWYLLEHGEVSFVLTQSGLNETLEWPVGLQRICLDNEELAGVDDLPLDSVQQPEDLAYVMFTSGSTGLPKGVMIDHRGAVNTILDMNERFGVSPDDRILALSALGFDLSVYDIFGTLAAGGTIIMPDQKHVRDPSKWAQLIVQENVTIWNSVPALMQLLVEYLNGHPGLPSLPLRLVLMSGDWIPVVLPDQVKAQLGEVQTISLGGATEASIWSILYPIETVDPAWTSIPYGKPMANQQFYVLNEALAPCPVWVPGQLFIGGIGLARGYWRDQEKTETSFIIHPQTTERLYRTGDLGRYLPDGNIEFLGREDFQVQIQGYRVELEEIEAALAQHPGVRTVVVTALGETHGGKSLAAYVVPEGKPAPKIRQLRQFVQKKLPEYMIPSAFVLLDQLPLTPNGKVDRQSLPDPGRMPAKSLQARPADAPNITDRIGQLVASVLKIDPIDPETNLLHLGATSVDMIRIVNLLDSKLNFRPQINEFYRLPTVSGLARSYEQHQYQGQRRKGAAEHTILGTPDSAVAGFQLLLDPEERAAFRIQEHGLRRGVDGRPYVVLHLVDSDDMVKEAFTQRRSYRHFSPEPIPFVQFSRLLGCLRQIRLDGKPKYLFGSAGGLYPVQTYLYVKPGRVEALDGGIYYFHPADCRLVLLSKNAEIDRDVYDPIINGPIFDEAAFGLFLIAQMGAIVPMYGDRSMHYVVIEAGLMAQLLEITAPAGGIGFCQIGDLDFKPIRHLFALDQSHVLVHSLLGGLIDSEPIKSRSPFEHPAGGRDVSDGDWEEGEI